MFKDKSICVVVPAHNEEKLIGRVIEAMPEFVDRIVVVDDKSSDRTVEVVQEYQNPWDERVVLIQHEENQGVGGAIATGCAWIRDQERADVVVTMDGDGQMDPKDLPALLNPVVDGETDCTKGNRLFTGDAWKMMPKGRYLGNAILSLLTKIASGYWHIADFQSGYRAFSSKVLHTLNFGGIYKRYGAPNDFLIHLDVYDFRVRDVSVAPVYRIGEKSGLRIWNILFTLSFLLIKRFFWRMKEKYVIRDFHPLIFEPSAIQPIEEAGIVCAE